ncbi:tetratricopeptide repeat protein [Runella zeae]|uniref:tetratricopeptide repeat protein n=1 Tax=Runella zeae TaxID=94255 RepID=UPI0023576767|nr:tetratricopeptide repeat protein [Runella zeae]
MRHYLLFLLLFFVTSSWGQTAEHYLEAGFQKHQNKDFKGGIVEYTKAIELKEDYAQAYNNRAACWHELGHIQEALEDFNNALQIDPYYASAYYNKALSLITVKRYNEAIDDLNKAIQLNSEDYDYYYSRGNVLRDIGRIEEAIQDFNKAIELNPEDSNSYNNRGNILKNIGLNKKALEDYNKSIQFNPNNAHAYNNRGVILDNSANYIEAIKDFNKAIEINPNYIEAYNNRGSSLENLGLSNKAIEDFNKAIELNPEYAEAYYSKAFSLDKLGNHLEAIKNYNKAIELKPKFSYLFYFNRGNSFKKMGLYREAINDYNTAIQLQLDSTPAKNKLKNLEDKIKEKRAPKIWIVAVGIDNYEHTALFSTLRSSVDNIHKLKDIFVLSHLAEESQINILPNHRATKQNILNIIDKKLCNSQIIYPEDMIIFYFIGHGIALNDSFGICPYDYLKGNKLISETELVNKLQSSPARHKICIIESCKSKNIPMTTANVSSQKLKQFNELRDQYKATTVVITSTKVGESSIEDQYLGGIFSHYLLLGMKGKADGHGSGKKDNMISTRELYQYVKENVKRQTKGIQTPQINTAAFIANIPLLPVFELDKPSK